MWYLSWSGIKSLSPGLAGGFFTTEPARKPLSMNFYLRSPWESHGSVINIYWVNEKTVIETDQEKKKKKRFIQQAFRDVKNCLSSTEIWVCGTGNPAKQFSLTWSLSISSICDSGKDRKFRWTWVSGAVEILSLRSGWHIARGNPVSIVEMRFIT